MHLPFPDKLINSPIDDDPKTRIPEANGSPGGCF